MKEDFDKICNVEEYKNIIESKKIKNYITTTLSESNISHIVGFGITLFFFGLYIEFIDNFTKDGLLVFSWIMMSCWAFLFFRALSLEKLLKINTCKKNNNESDFYFFMVTIPIGTPFIFMLISVIIASLLEHFLDIGTRNTINVLYMSLTGFLIFGSIFLFSKFNIGIQNKYKDIDNKNYENRLFEIKRRIKEHTNDITTLECYIELTKIRGEEDLTDLLSDILNEQLKENGYNDLYEYKKSLINTNELTVENT